MSATLAFAPAPSAAARRKAFKGVLALAAAGLLLGGGASTYALWSDTVTLNGGNINSGQLSFAGTGAGTWYDVSTGAAAPIADIAAFNVVPGDIIEYRVSRTVEAEGNNLVATLEADPGSVTGDAALLADMDVSTVVSIAGAPTATITEANDGAQVDVNVTFAFDEASTNGTQLQSLDLSALELSLTQNAR